MRINKVVVAAEIYSSNLGDNFIFQSISELLDKHGVEAVPLDLSSRRGWSNNLSTDLDKASMVRESILKAVAKKANLNSKFTRRLRAWIYWTLIRKNKTTKLWEPFIEQADAVLIGGGQILTDNNFEFPLRLHLISKLAEKHGKPLAIFGCGVGKEWSAVSTRIYQQIADKSVFFSVRDEISLKRISTKLNLSKFVHVHPDVVFAREDARAVNSSENMTCGLNILPLAVFHRFVDDLKQFDGAMYLGFWERLVKSIIKEKMEVVLLTNGNQNDYEQAKLVHRHLEDSGIPVRLQKRPERPHVLLSQLAEIDFLVAMRMHAGIIGFTLGKPVTTIAWDAKVAGVWECIDGAKVVVPPSVLTVEDPWTPIKAAFSVSEDLSRDRVRISNKVEEAFERCLSSLEKNL